MCYSKKTTKDVFGKSSRGWIEWLDFCFFDFLEKIQRLPNSPGRNG